MKVDIDDFSFASKEGRSASVTVMRFAAQALQTEYVIKNKDSMSVAIDKHTDKPIADLASRGEGTSCQ